MSALLLLVLALPLISLAFASFAQGTQLIRGAQRLGWISLGGIALAAAVFFAQGERTLSLALAGEGGARLDVIAFVFLLVSGIVAAAVLRFSARYLEGDPRQDAFMRRLLQVSAGVQLMAVAPGVLQFALAGLWVSWRLSQLLRYHPQRPLAQRSSRLYWRIALLADGSLLVLAGWMLLSHGSTAWSVWSAAPITSETTPMALLVVLAALCKSAQLPFHLWLPDTLETPTPVSALLHAGVVNAGGFLLIRSGDLLAAVPGAALVLIASGVLTAVFGAIVMLTQTTVKSALAYSTVAQMGFLILQCGFGAYGLALLHIAAHALYKANAFLRSGSVLEQPPRHAVVLPWRSFWIGVGAGAILGGGLFWLVPALRSEPGMAVWLTVLIGACAYSVARFDAADPGAGLWHGLGRALLAIVLTVLLHSLVAQVIPVSASIAIPPLVEGLVAFLFGCLLLFQFFLARLRRLPFWRRLYVHASHGFYLQTFVGRLVVVRA